MKKPYNAFKAVQLTNALRLVTFICLVALVLIFILYFSVAENRQSLLGWFGISSPNVNKEVVTPSVKNDAGLTDPVSLNQTLKVRPLDQNDHLWGEINAPVNLIIYEDFECPFCAQFYETVNRAKSEFGNDLVVAIRHFPLASHDLAIGAAMASECAAEKNKFWEMYHELFKTSKTTTLKPEELIKAAVTIGLDAEAFTDCLTKEEYKAKILAQKEEVKVLGVIGTPASFLNNEYLAGAMPYEDFDYPDGARGKGLKTLIQEKLDGISKDKK